MPSKPVLISTSEPAISLPTLALYDQAALAELLCISKKTVQNLYSKTPHRLPPAIDIPGARGPRWTAASILAWLEGRPVHTSVPVPVMPKRSVGRPRIATMGRK